MANDIPSQPININLTWRNGVKHSGVINTYFTLVSTIRTFIQNGENLERSPLIYFKNIGKEAILLSFEDDNSTLDDVGVEAEAEFYI